MTEKGQLSEIGWKFEWQIEDFFSPTDEHYISPNFRVSDSLWYIQIFPKYGDQNSEKYISLYLFKYGNETPTAVEFRVGIKTVNNAIEYEERGFHNFRNDGWGWDNFIETSELVRRSAELVPSGILTITCSAVVKSTVSDFDSSEYKV